MASANVLLTFSCPTSPIPLLPHTPPPALTPKAPTSHKHLLKPSWGNREGHSNITQWHSVPFSIPALSLKFLSQPLFLPLPLMLTPLPSPRSSLRTPAPCTAPWSKTETNTTFSTIKDLQVSNLAHQASGDGGRVLGIPTRGEPPNMRLTWGKTRAILQLWASAHSTPRLRQPVRKQWFRPPLRSRQEFGHVVLGQSLLDGWFCNWLSWWGKKKKKKIMLPRIWPLARSLDTFP